ncbi:MAG: cytochrome c, partial [Planctomycetes bacterium]|nr:cytochrome c [Planctomycetota bacterium]
MKTRILFFGLSLLYMGTGEFHLAQAQAPAEAEASKVDHVGIIKALDDRSLQRGQKVYQLFCMSCHGADGDHPILPTARRFGRDRFKYGTDPYTMWRTVSRGFEVMPPQRFLPAEDRYAVIQYIRETFVKPNNPGEYFEVTDAYLRRLSNPQAPEEASSSEGGHPRDYGPALASQFRRKVNSALTVKLSGRHMISYDLHRLHTVALWKGFLNLSRTQHMMLRGEGQPYPQGDLIRGMENWHWAFEEGYKLSDYQNQTPGLEKRLATGPLDKAWMDYHGHYLFGNQVILSYGIGGREVLEMPAMEETEQVSLLSQTLRIEGGKGELKLCVGQMEKDEDLLFRPDAGKGWKESIVWGKTDRQSGKLERFFGVAVVGDAAGFIWETDENQRVGVRIPAGTKTRSVRFYRFSGSGSEELERYQKYISDARQQGRVIDLKTLTAGGPGRWGVELTTQGQVGNPNAIHYDPIYYKSPDRHEQTRKQISSTSTKS